MERLTKEEKKYLAKLFIVMMLVAAVILAVISVLSWLVITKLYHPETRAVCVTLFRLIAEVSV